MPVEKRHLGVVVLKYQSSEFLLESEQIFMELSCAVFYLYAPFIDPVL